MKQKVQTLQLRGSAHDIVKSGEAALMRQEQTKTGTTRRR